MPRRRVLVDIPPNIQRGKELSDATKERLIGRAAAGQTGGQIAAIEQLPESTVYHAIQRIQKRQTTANAVRSGRPKDYTTRDKRAVIRAVRKDPKLTYKDLRKETGLNLSNDTFKRILKADNILHWRSKRRPELLPSHARLRLQFARSMLAQDWSIVIFSDECSVEKGAGQKRQWSFGYPHQKWDHDKIDVYPKGKQGSIMVWASIGGTASRSELIIMDRDQAAPRGGYSAASYIDTLEQGLIPIYNGETYIHDNAPIHTARLTTTWLNNRGIYVLPNWPPYSPDLNPIEHLWPRLKEVLYDLHPEILLITSLEAQKKALIEYLPEAWQRVKTDVMKAVIDSMPRRLQAVIDAQGWQTRY
jgi:transposase